jgi:hypothetical protein
MSRNTFNTVSYEWIAARFTGKQAKFVSAQASAGCGYYTLERPDKGDGWIVVAYRQKVSKELKSGMDFISDQRLIEKLERWSKPLEYKMIDRRQEIEREQLA